jgi:hypothetical protein
MNVPLCAYLSIHLFYRADLITYIKLELQKVASPSIILAVTNNSYFL